LAQFGESLLDRIDTLFDALAKVQCPGGGQDALGVPVEQGVAQAIFQARDSAAHGGLRHAQLLGCAAHRTRPAYTEKGVQLDERGGLEIHGDDIMATRATKVFLSPARGAAYDGGNPSGMS
jgi:hypothetical protein